MIPHTTITIDKNTYEALQQELMQLRREVKVLRSSNFFQGSCQNCSYIESYEHKNSELSAMLNAFPDLFFKVAADSTILDFKVGNKTSELYLPPEEFLGKPMLEVLPPSVGKKFEISMAQLQKTSSMVSIEYSLPMSGGEEYYEARLVPFVNNQIIAIVRNVSDKKRAEEALQQNIAQYRNIFEAITDGLLIFDLETENFVEANPAVCLMHGYSKEEFLALQPTDYVHPNYFHLFENCIETIKNGGEFYCQGVDVRKDGTLFDIEVKACVCMYNGKLHGLTITRDISDRKRAEIELQQKTQDLSNALLQLQNTQAQLIHSEKMSSLGQMVAGVAHEINNPANFIHGNLAPACEYVQDLFSLVALYQKYYPNPPAEIKEEIEAIDLDFLEIDLIKLLKSMQEGTRRIREIVLSLRSFSRLDEAEFKQADIHEGIDSTLMILRNRLKGKPNAKEIQVIKKYSHIPNINCYPGQLNQVFMNILANAIDALVSKSSQTNFNQLDLDPTIRISTELIDGNLVAIRIADNGIGIGQNLMSKLFDPFFTTKEVGKGTGLGLSISYQIVVEKHGGKLYCHSQPGQGTEFTIEIPIMQPKANSEQL